MDVVEAYRTIMPAEAPARAKEALARKPDWITFTSSSTVKNLVAALGVAEANSDEAGGEVLRRYQRDGGRFASIGPITSATARECGLTIDAQADPHTIDGLVEAIARHKK